MDIEVKCNNVDELALEYNEVNEVLDTYKKEILRMMYRQVELDGMITKSNEFKEAVVDWVRKKPEEVLPIYFVAEGDAYEENIIRYGDMLSNGPYCDFCDKFVGFVEGSVYGEMEKYIIENNETGEKRIVSLKEMVMAYKDVIGTDEVKYLNVKMGQQEVKYQVTQSEIKENGDGGIYFGRVYVETNIAVKLKNVIDEVFVIESIKDRPVAFNKKDNVVSIMNRKSVI